MDKFKLGELPKAGTILDFGDYSKVTDVESLAAIVSCTNDKLTRLLAIDLLIYKGIDCKFTEQGVWVFYNKGGADGSHV